MSPRSANGLLALLRAIMNAAVADFALPNKPVAGVKAFSNATRPAYTEEQPNALTADELVGSIV